MTTYEPLERDDTEACFVVNLSPVTVELGRVYKDCAVGVLNYILNHCVCT